MKTVNGKLFRSLIWGAGLTVVTVALLLSAPTHSVADRSEVGPSPLFQHSLRKSLERIRSAADSRAPVSRERPAAVRDPGRAGSAPVAPRDQKNGDSRFDWAEVAEAMGRSQVNSVVIESKSVIAGATSVPVRIFVENIVDISGFALPLEIRAIDPGSYIANSLVFTVNPVGRIAASGLMNITTLNFRPTPDGVNSCSGPISNTYSTQGAVDFVSPDALMWSGVRFLDPCLAAGADGFDAASFVLTFDVTNVPGELEIDTCCVVPSNHLLFVDCATAIGIEPVFTKGVVTIVPVGSGYRRGDINCDGSVDIDDAIAYSDYLFSGATLNCIPASDVNCDGITLTTADMIALIRYVFGMNLLCSHDWLPGFCFCPIPPSPTMPPMATCNGLQTCPPGCGGPTSQGIPSCAPAASCAVMTCPGQLTCPPAASCRGVPSCSGSESCFPAETCSGAATCDYEETMEGLPTCASAISCPWVPECDSLPTLQSQPSCPGWLSCQGWESCDGSPSCSGSISCSWTASCHNIYTCAQDFSCYTITPVPTMEGGWTCPGSEDCESVSIHGSAGASSTLGSAEVQIVGYPVVYSVDGPANPAEGLRQPDPSHPQPNDVFALGPWLPAAWDYGTRGELFQSSGMILGAPPDMTNLDRISASLGLGPAPGGGPPFMGPFSPNAGAPDPLPLPPGGAGTMGLAPSDNLNALSYGRDGGTVLLFSVDWAAIGIPGTAVDYQANISPGPSSPIGALPSNCGGDPGNEAAGDIFVSSWLAPFGSLFGQIVLAPALTGENALEIDELDLGLQAPAVACGIGPQEDDLDALEAADADNVDADGDGIPDIGTPVFFSLDPTSTAVLAPTADPFPGLSTGGDSWVTPDDILVSPPPGGPSATFAIYARGVQDICLLPGDDIDALCLWDSPPIGILSAGDEALFSLAIGSPSLASGANPCMPGVGPLSPGDVFRTSFPGAGGAIVMYAEARALGLDDEDELDALDIGYCYCAYDSDSSLVSDVCQIGYTHWGVSVSVALTPSIVMTYAQVTLPGVSVVSILSTGPAAPTGFIALSAIPPATVSVQGGGRMVPNGLTTLSADQSAYYHIETSARFSDSITISFTYDEGLLSGPEDDLRVFHYEEVSPGDTQWVDVTGSLNTVTNEINGVVASLSPFILAEPLSCECDCQGDESCDSLYNVFDVVFAVGEAFRNDPYTPDPNPNCPLIGMNDLNFDGDVNVFDVVFLVNLAFRNGSRADNICDPCTEVGPPGCPF